MSAEDGLSQNPRKRALSSDKSLANIVGLAITVIDKPPSKRFKPKQSAYIERKTAGEKKSNDGTPERVPLSLLRQPLSVSTQNAQTTHSHNRYEPHSLKASKFRASGMTKGSRIGLSENRPAVEQPLAKLQSPFRARPPFPLQSRPKKVLRTLSSREEQADHSFGISSALTGPLRRTHSLQTSRTRPYPAPGVSGLGDSPFHTIQDGSYLRLPRAIFTSPPLAASTPKVDNDHDMDIDQSLILDNNPAFPLIDDNVLLRATNRRNTDAKPSALSVNFVLPFQPASIHPGAIDQGGSLASRPTRTHSPDKLSDHDDGDELQDMFSIMGLDEMGTSHPGSVLQRSDAASTGRQSRAAEYTTKRYGSAAGRMEELKKASQPMVAAKTGQTSKSSIVDSSKAATSKVKHIKDRNRVSRNSSFYPQHPSHSKAHLPPRKSRHLKQKFVRMHIQDVPLEVFSDGEDELAAW